jgi:hypothetical protein
MGKAKGQQNDSCHEPAEKGDGHRGKGFGKPPGNNEIAGPDNGRNKSEPKTENGLGR